MSIRDDLANLVAKGNGSAYDAADEILAAGWRPQLCVHYWGESTNGERCVTCGTQRPVVPRTGWDCPA